MLSREFELLLLLSVVLGFAYLLYGLVRELGVNPKQRWLLSLGLGAGLGSFAVKLFLLAGFNHFPSQFLALPADQKQIASTWDQ